MNETIFLSYVDKNKPRNKLKLSENKFETLVDHSIALRFVTITLSYVGGHGR